MDALDELFAKLGFDRRMLTRITLIFSMLFVGSCVLAVYLSAWDMKKGIVGMLYVYMTLVALPLLFSPVLWLVGGGILSLAGQFGGEKGPSLKDAVAALKEYGTPALDKGAYAILFAIPVWHIAMLIFDTKGMEEWFLAALPVLPTLIYLCIRRWKTGEAFEAIARTTILGLVILGALWGIYNTINRAVTDPVVLKAREVQERMIEEGKTRDARRFELIEQHLKNGWKLEKEHLDWYNGVMRQAAETPAAQVKSMISSAASAVTDEGSATTSTSANWLGKNWPILAGAVLIILIVVLIARRRKTVTATVTVAASPAASNNKLTRIVVEFILGLVVTIGLWVWWTSDPGYAESMSFTVYDRTPQKICGYPKFPKGGKLMFVLPDEKHGKISAQVVGSDEDINLATQIMVHGETKGRTFASRPDGQCVLVNWVIDSGWEDKLKVPVTVKVMIIRFHGIGVVDWVMSQYYK